MINKNIYLTAREAAHELGIPLLDFVNYRIDNNLESLTEDGKLFFKRQMEPPKPEKIEVEEEAIGGTYDDIIRQHLIDWNVPGRSGIDIHTSGLYQALEKSFPDKKPEELLRAANRRKRIGMFSFDDTTRIFANGNLIDRDIQGKNAHLLPQSTLDESVTSYVLDLIDERRKLSLRRGVHCKFDNFNSIFSSDFPDLDAITVTQEMAKHGMIRIYPRHGGVDLYLNDTWKPTKPKEESLEAESTKTFMYKNKNAWRDFRHHFSDSNLGVKSNQRALILGGYGDEIPGLQRREIQNVDVIEKDKDRASQIKITYPETDVHAEKLIDFLKSTSQKYDDIMLDYEGQLTEGKLEEMVSAVSRCKPHASFGINILGRRESNNITDLYLDGLLDANGWLEKNKLKDHIPDHLVDSDRKHSLRSYGLSAWLLRCVHAAHAPRFNESLSEFLGMAQNEIAPKNDPSRKTSDTILHDIRTSMDLIELTKSGLDQEKIDPMWAIARAIYVAKPHYVQDHARHLYRSVGKQKNDYYTDMVSLEQPQLLYMQHFNKNEWKDAKFSPFKDFLMGKEGTNNPREYLIQKFANLPRMDKVRLQRMFRPLRDELITRYQTLFMQEELPIRSAIPNSKYEVPRPIIWEAASLLHKQYSSEQVKELFPGIDNSISRIKQLMGDGYFDSYFRRLDGIHKGEYNDSKK